MVLCNDNFDPNQAAACGRKAVDSKALAVVGAASSYSGQVLAILQQWNIPFLNGQGTGGAVELTNPVSFPLHGGTAVQQVGMGRSLANAGSKNIVVIAADVDVARKAGEDVIRGAKLGGAAASAVYAPLGAPDYSAVAAAALDKKPDGIAIAHVPADAPKIILALRQAGYTGRISTLMSVLNAAGIKAIGDAAEGVFLLDRASQPTNTSIPQIKEYQEGLAKYEPKAAIDPSSLNGWISVSFFQQLVLQMGKAKITPESLLAKLRKLDKPIVVGAFPDYTGPSATPPVPEFPQVVTFQANLLKVQGGVVVPNGGFFNPLAP